MRDNITSSDLMAYLMFATGFLGTFLTIYHLFTREWEFVWMHSTTAALAFIVILLMDRDRKRKENLKIPRD
jgi:Kef-type K+ transport system membrane component KefB